MLCYFCCGHPQVKDYPGALCSHLFLGIWRMSVSPLKSEGQASVRVAPVVYMGLTQIRPYRKALDINWTLQKHLKRVYVMASQPLEWSTAFRSVPVSSCWASCCCNVPCRNNKVLPLVSTIFWGSRQSASSKNQLSRSRDQMGCWSQLWDTGILFQVVTASFCWNSVNFCPQTWVWACGVRVFSVLSKLNSWSFSPDGFVGSLSTIAFLLQT